MTSNSFASAMGALSLAMALLVAIASAEPATMHTIFTTECGEYFTWQSMGLVYSHKKSGQRGRLTRVMSCTPEEWAALSEEQRAIVPTHVAPSYTRHPRTGDMYSAYNKPVAVIDWLARNNVTEDYVLIIDADMIIREPFLPETSGARPGRAVSAYFSYMKGVKNRLAEKHIPDVLPRNDTLAGPEGRKADQVGGFTLMYTEDLRRVAPLWLKYTEDVRADPDAWELSGDSYSIHPGDKPWISEMYGYSYACAKSDVWHICHQSAMLYPGYEVHALPMVLHYGLLWEVKGSDPPYSFDKHWHYDFNPLKCPPWDLSRKANPMVRGARSVGKGGLFPHPPHPSSFKTSGFELLRDLLAVEVPITLNQAFCERHRAQCMPSEQLDLECGVVDDMAEALQKRMATLDLPDPCRDKEKRCAKWAADGECRSNPGYMFSTCAKSCGKCKPRVPAAKKRPDVVGDTNADAQDGSAEGIASSANGTDAAAEQKAAVVEEVSGLEIPELKLRCTRFPKWTATQVKHCMTLAADGMEYDPLIDDPDAAATAAELHASAHHLLHRTHDFDVTRLLGQDRTRMRPRSGRQTTEDALAAAAVSPGSMGVAAWGLALGLLVLCLVRGHQRRRRARANSMWSPKDSARQD